jgi:hypothetical protein
VVTDEDRDHQHKEESDDESELEFSGHVLCIPAPAAGSAGFEDQPVPTPGAILGPRHFAGEYESVASRRTAAV